MNLAKERKNDGSVGEGQNTVLFGKRILMLLMRGTMHSDDGDVCGTVPYVRTPVLYCNARRTT